MPASAQIDAVEAPRRPSRAKHRLGRGEDFLPLLLMPDRIDLAHCPACASIFLDRSL